MLHIVLSTQPSGPISLEPSKILPVFLIWTISLLILFVVIKKNKYSSKVGVIMLGLNLIVTGIIFGATPNPVMPLQQISATIGQSNQIQLAFQQIMPFLIILMVLLFTGVVFGRLFCGYACPLGALQELFSKIRFKKDAKSVKARPNLPKVGSKTGKIFRFAFLGVFIAVLGLMGAAIAQYLNPFLGFQIFRNPALALALVPSIYLGIIALISVFVYRPWCRFFCPFGALIAETSKVSRFKLRRNDNCIDCGLCEDACPTDEAKANDNKSECYLCMRCVQICPKNAIDFARENPQTSSNSS